MEIDDGITDEDRSLIERMVRAIPDIDHRILEIEVLMPGRVRVTTGELPDPEAGRGHSVEFDRINGRWWGRPNTWCEWIAS